MELGVELEDPCGFLLTQDVLSHLFYTRDSNRAIPPREERLASLVSAVLGHGLSVLLGLC